MKRRAIISTVIAGAVALGGGALVWTADAPASVVQVVTSDNTFGTTFGEVLAPPPDGAVPAVTAQAAFDQSLGLPDSQVIPGEVSVQLGLYTLPIGPAASCQQSGDTCPGAVVVDGTAYQVYQRLAYAFEWSDCGGSLTAACQSWEFVDAATGADLGGLRPRGTAGPASPAAKGG